MLETDRLVLRPARRADAEELLDVFGDPDVMRWMGKGATMTIEEIRTALDRKAKSQQEYGVSLWTVIEKSSNRIIGDCGLALLEGGPKIEVGFRLGREHWGKGYATEPARESLHYGFATLGLGRVFGVAKPDNVASRRVMQKIGMRYLGCDKAYDVDVVVYLAERPVIKPIANLIESSE